MRACTVAVIFGAHGCFNFFFFFAWVVDFVEHLKWRPLWACHDEGVLVKCGTQCTISYKPIIPLLPTDVIENQMSWSPHKTPPLTSRSFPCYQLMSLKVRYLEVLTNFITGPFSTKCSEMASSVLYQSCVGCTMFVGNSVSFTKSCLVY